jgi:hypothetical protein
VAPDPWKTATGLAKVELPVPINNFVAPVILPEALIVPFTDKLPLVIVPVVLIVFDPNAAKKLAAVVFE